MQCHKMNGVNIFLKIPSHLKKMPFQSQILILANLRKKVSDLISRLFEIKYRFCFVTSIRFQFRSVRIFFEMHRFRPKIFVLIVFVAGSCWSQKFCRSEDDCSSSEDSVCGRTGKIRFYTQTMLIHGSYNPRKL